MMYFFNKYERITTNCWSLFFLLSIMKVIFKERNDYMKRIYLLLLMLIGAVALIGCEGTKTLEVPKNVTISGNTVSWNSVTGADSYIVVVNSNEHVVTSTSLDLSTLNLPAGTYSIAVVARKGAQVSLPTTAVNYVVEGNTVTLNAPIINLTGNILSWQAIANATGYQVIVNNTLHTTTQTTFDLSALGLAAGTYSITVKATAGTLLSQASAPKNYTVISVENREVIYANLLKAVNPSYEPDMDETDFENEFEYDQYAQMETMVNLYLDIAVSEGMDPVEMVSMMTFMVELPIAFENPDPSLLKEEFDKLGDYGMSPQIFASFVLSLGSEALTIAKEEMMADKADYESDLNNRQDEVATVVISIEFQLMISALQGYVSSEDQLLFAAFISQISNLDLSRIMSASRLYASSLIYEYEYMPEFYDYGDETDVYIDLFEKIIWNAYMANDMTLVNSVASYFEGFFDPLWQIQTITSDLKYYQERIDEIENEVEMITMIIDMLKDESEHVRIILEEVSTYIQTLYQAMPATLMTDIEALLASGELSTDEVIILKDEIVTILIDTIPSEDSFTLFYETFITLAGSLAGYNVTTLTSHAETLAQLQRNSTLLSLEFILSIDETTVDDIMVITDGMIIPGYYDAYEMTQYGPQVDASQLAEFVIYGLTYVDSFLTEQATLVDAIEAIDENPMIIDFMTFVAAIAKQQLEAELEPDMYVKIAALIDESVLAIPDYIAFYETVYGMDLALINHVIDTEGALLLDIATFIESPEMSPELMLNFFELMVDHLMDYRGLIRSDIDEAFISDWLDLLKLPMKGTCIQGGIDDDCDGIFEAVKPFVVDVLMNLLEIEEAMMIEVDSVANINAMINSWGVDFETGVMIHIILSVKDVMDQKRVLMDQTVNIIFDSILANTDIQGLLMITSQDLLEAKTNVLDGIAHIDSETDRIALFDFANLTEQQLSDIQSLFDIVESDIPVDVK